MNYYGTELNHAGHYYWQLEGDAIYRPRHGAQHYPFEPEHLPYDKSKRGLPNGFAAFYQFAGFSIYAIEGSCADTRPASKSIFFIEKELDKDQMKALIMSTPIARKIVQKMPFEVQW